RRLDADGRCRREGRSVRGRDPERRAAILHPVERPRPERQSAASRRLRGVHCGLAGARRHRSGARPHVETEPCDVAGTPVALESEIVSTRQRRSRISRGIRKRRRPPLSQTRALRVLKEVAEALNRATTEQHATGEALSRMVDLLGVETGWVWLRDPASDRFYNAAVQSLPPYLQEPVRMTGRSCWCLELFRKGQLTARNIDVVECSRLAPAAASREVASTAGLRCHASVPLYAGDRPLGVMNLAMRGWRRLTRQE